MDKKHIDPWNDPSINPEPGSDKNNEDEEFFKKTLYEDLINLIIKYYSTPETMSFFEGEDWKRNLNPPSREVPNDLDEMVKFSFMSKLREHL